MLWTLFVILLVSWLAGVVSSVTIGGFIHFLLALALIALLTQLLTGQTRGLTLQSTDGNQHNVVTEGGEWMDRSEKKGTMGKMWDEVKDFGHDLKEELSGPSKENKSDRNIVKHEHDRDRDHGILSGSDSRRDNTGMLPGGATIVGRDVAASSANTSSIDRDFTSLRDDRDHAYDNMDGDADRRVFGGGADSSSDASRPAFISHGNRDIEDRRDKLKDPDILKDDEIDRKHDYPGRDKKVA